MKNAMTCARHNKPTITATAFRDVFLSHKGKNGTVCTDCGEFISSSEEELLKPALTAEEWVHADGKIGVTPELGENMFAHGHNHALAALCLHGQDFGFTMEDVVVLRGAQSALNFECLDRGFDRPCTLADRIEALLPPETKDLPSSG